MTTVVAETAFATRQALDIATIKATERPASSRSRQAARPSTSSSSLSSKSGKTKASTREGLASHVMINLATLEPNEKNRSPPTTMSNTRAPTPAQHERSRQIAPSSSWSSLKFSRKSSRESLVDDRNDAMGSRNQPLRRFQSLGFLRKKGSSISIAPSTSTSSLASAPLQAGSSHGHSSSNSNSSNGSHSQQQQQSRAQAIQSNHSHTVPVSTVFPTMSSGTTFTLTLTPGKAPPSSSAKAAAVASFARPPKANPVSRRSISLYETSSPKPDVPLPTSSASRPSRKKVVPLPSTKTTVVARAPCAYDVTALRPARAARPRSSSLPFDSVLDSRLEHMVPSADTEAETVAPTASSLNTTTVSDVTNSSTAMPPSSSTSTSNDRSAASSRTHHRYAAVYRPPPPVDANGYARPGHPKPALSLSMPSGVSIIEPLRSTKGGAAASKPNASPSSPASTPSSSRPPPRAPIPVSPDASPDRGLKPLPSLPPVSRSFGSPSPISSHPGTPWTRQRSESITKSPSIFSNRSGEGGNVSLNYTSASPKISVKSPHTASTAIGSSPVSTNSPKPSISDKYTVGSVRTVYSATPTIPINTKRRPSLPLTSALRDSVDSYSTDQGDQLWGYFEKKGLTSVERSRSATGSPATTSVDLPPVAMRGLSRMDSERYTQTMYLPTQVYTPQTPSSLSTPPLTGGVSPVSPFHAKPTRQQRPGTDSGVPSDRLHLRGTQKKPHERPERLRPTHIISHSSAAALPSPSEQYSFLPSPAPSTFFGSGLTLPETPITPAPKSWTDLKSDADSMVLPSSPFTGRSDAFYLDTARPHATRAA